MKVLNLYAGIGGNRKLWEDVDVTAVEINEEVAKVYQDYFPDDEVIIGDAHQYLLDHYDEFDFIWSSPPCPTHFDMRRCGVHRGQNKALYPDMDLYEEILLLDNFAPLDCRWVVENVVGYYNPLIPPSKKLHRHYYWSNFKIQNFNVTDERKHNKISDSSTVYGFNISDTNIGNKRKALRNMVDPMLGLHILDRARGIVRKSNTEQMSLL